jgi:hypothetical protein
MATKDKDTPQIIQVVPINQEAERAANMALGRELAMDTTVEGGRYIVNGKEVDANGKPLKGADAEPSPNANDAPSADAGNGEEGKGSE